MRTDLGSNPFIFPMPVLMIATYGDNDEVDVMNMAWGGICGEKMIALNIAESHKTSENIKKRNAFTVSIADAAHVAEADYFGMISGKKIKDKFAKSGMHAEKSKFVDAPVVEEFPLALECKVLELQHYGSEFRVLGEIINVTADERILDNERKVDPAKLDALVFDTFNDGYYKVGDRIANAFDAGRDIIDRAGAHSGE
jgi:Conserved protein/domain typically associated with flavoprotein oxygenases, DIM6/NTAB family